MLLRNKRFRWRIMIAIFLAVLVVNVVNVPRVYATECGKLIDWLTLGHTCLAEYDGERAARGAMREIKPAFNEMVDKASEVLLETVHSIDWEKIGRQAGQGAGEAMLEALDSIDWQAYGQKVGAGLRQEFELLMENLFEDKIQPLLRDIDMLLKQTNQMAEDRLKQADEIIKKRLQQIDGLVQNTIAQFQTVANKTIENAKQKLITYAFERAEKFRDQTMAQIRTDIVDYAAHTFQGITDETIQKIKQDLIAYSLEQAKTFRKQTVAQIRTDIIDYAAHTFQTFTDENVEKIKQALIAYTFERAEKFRQQTVAQIRTDIVDYAADTVQKVTEETVNTVKTDLIDHTFTKLYQFRKLFRTDVNQLINQIDCKVAGNLEKFRIDLSNISEKLAKEFKELKINLPFLSPSNKTAPKVTQVSSCYQKLGLTKPPKPFQYSTIYDLEKCEVLATLTPKTPIRQVLNVYLDLANFATRMACVQRAAGERASLHYTWDWLEFEYQYDLWYSTQQ